MFAIKAQKDNYGSLLRDDIHIDDEVNAVKLAAKTSAFVLPTNVPTYFLTSKLKKRTLSVCINGSFRNSDKRLKSVQNTEAR